MPQAISFNGTVSLVIALAGCRDLDPGPIPELTSEIGKIFTELRSDYPDTPLIVLSVAGEGAARFAPSGVRVIELPGDGDAPERLAALSHILIAIRQGTETEHAATVKTVRAKLRHDARGRRLSDSRMNGYGAGPVYLLAAGGAPALLREVRYPESSGPADYEGSYELLNRYNRDVTHPAPGFPASVAASRRHLLEGAQAVGLPEAMEWVAAVYSCADALALHFERSSRRMWKALFLLLGVAGLAFTLRHLIPGGELFLFLYYACLGLCLLLIIRERKAERRGRHEDYRALAEALRVQFFWMAAGIPDRAASQYLRKQAGEMVWIREAIGECGLYGGVPERLPADSNASLPRLRIAINWVRGQRRYFAARTARHAAKRMALDRLAWAAAGVGLTTPLAGLFVGSALPDAVAGVSMWCAALAWDYAERRGFAQEARQYERMHDLFRSAGEDLEEFEREGNLAACEETIRELGREALAENGDWLSMHRERQLSTRAVAR